MPQAPDKYSLKKGLLIQISYKKRKIWDNKIPIKIPDELEKVETKTSKTET